MKKILIFLLLIFLLMLSGCPVSEITGAIRIINSTGLAVKNIKVTNSETGKETILTPYISKGQEIRYTFFNPVEGKLTGEGIQDYANEANLYFRLNYMYIISIVISDDQYYFDIEYYGQGIDSNDWEEPWE